MPEKLKPCPFCGEKELIHLRTWRDEDATDSVVKCGICGAESNLFCNGTKAENEVATIAAWNNRPDIRRETIEECAKACEGMDKDIVCPEECAVIIRALAEATPNDRLDLDHDQDEEMARAGDSLYDLAEDQP